MLTGRRRRSPEPRSRETRTSPTAPGDHATALTILCLSPQTNHSVIASHPGPVALKQPNRSGVRRRRSHLFDCQRSWRAGPPGVPTRCGLDSASPSLKGERQVYSCPQSCQPRQSFALKKIEARVNPVGY